MLQVSAPSNEEIAKAQAFWRRTGARSLSAMEAAGGVGAIYLGIASLPLSWIAGGIFIAHGADVFGTSLVGAWKGELQTNLTTRFLGPEVNQGLALSEMVYAPFVFAPAGRWQTVNEAMSARARAYQTQVTGRTGEAYVVNGVRFDGVSGGTLLEAKGPGYATFVRNGEFQDFFQGRQQL